MELVLLVVTLVSLGLAAAMSVVGWRLLNGDRARSAARVEALEAEAMAIDVAIPEPVFVAPEPSAGFGRARFAIAAVALLVTGAGAVVFALHGSNRPTRDASVVTRSIPAVAPPLELLSVQHGARAHTFEVTGRVQNPASAVAATSIVAVVYFFDRADRLVTSARARVTSLSLEPGQGSSFAIRIATDAEIGRYRVVFERSDGALVPHVDRRTTSPAASSDPSRPASSDAAGGLGE